MLVLNVDWIIRLRGSKHPYSYLRNHGYSEQQARSLPGMEIKRVPLELLERLAVTFNCRLEDLFDWTGGPEHPLAYLAKPKLPLLEEMLEGKSPEEILAMIRALGIR